MKASTQNYFNEVKKKQRESLRNKVLSCFNTVDVWTSFEIQMNLGLSELVKVTRRMAELENDGLIYQTGSIEKTNGTFYAVYKLSKPFEIEEKRFKRWQTRRLEWIQQGINFGYITKEESQTLNKQ
jgi:hypothetical protein